MGSAASRAELAHAAMARQAQRAQRAGEPPPPPMGPDPVHWRGDTRAPARKISQAWLARAEPVSRDGGGGGTKGAAGVPDDLGDEVRRVGHDGRIFLHAICPKCGAPLQVWHGARGCWGCLTSFYPLELRRRLLRLWGDLSLSTAEIGRQLGRSKNAVVGLVHRLGFDPRPSPIIRSRAPLPPKRPPGASPDRRIRVKRAKPTKPAKTTPVPRATVAAVSPTVAPAAPGGTITAAEPTLIVPKATQAHPLPNRVGFDTCQFIENERDFCAEPVFSRSPYCALHTKLCYSPHRPT